MRVLLVNPPSRGIYYRLGLFLPPLGLGYLAAALREHGHHVDIVDLNVDRDALKNPPWEEWDVVGISGDTSRHQAAMEIARQAKEAGKTVVLGSYHATFMDAETLESGYVDYVIRGEGEQSFVELVKCLASKGDLSKVPGLSYLADGVVVRNPDSLPVNDLDSLPQPARDLLPMHRYRTRKLNGRPLTTLVTSRGCPYNCSFCSSSQFAGTKWRSRQPQKIVDEIEEVVSRYNFGAVAFMDDNFTLNPKRVREICREIVRRGLDVFWWCFSRVDTIVKNEAMVEDMARAGARMIFLGLENASQAVLNSYGKGFTTDVAARAVEILKKHGIRVWGSFIVGGMDETKENIRQTVQYAKMLDVDIAEFSILTPFPGTALFRQAQEEQRIVSYDWSLYDGAHAVMNTKNLTRKEIATETIKAYISFYGRLSRLKQVADGLKIYLQAIPKLSR